MKNLYNKLKEQGLISDTDKIIVTGHSLGGYLAQLFTLANYDTIDHAYTYNAPGLGGIKMNLMRLFSIDKPMKYNDKITDIVAIDGINAIHEVGINVGKEVKIASNLHGMSEMNQNHRFLRFCPK